MLPPKSGFARSFGLYLKITAGVVGNSAIKYGPPENRSLFRVPLEECAQRGTVDHHSMVRPLGGARHPHTPRLPAPSRPASAARALDDRRAGSPRGRLCSHARTLPTAVVTPARIECTMAIRRGQQLARRQGDASRRRSRCRDGWSDKRREQPRSRSREPQRPSPAVGDALHESAEGQLGSRSVNGRWQ
jgi:hypothetical protein